MGDPDSSPLGGDELIGDNNIPILGHLLRTRSLSQSDSSYVKSNNTFQKRMLESSNREKTNKAKPALLVLIK